MNSDFLHSNLKTEGSGRKGADWVGIRGKWGSMCKGPGAGEKSQHGASIHQGDSGVGLTSTLQNCWEVDRGQGRCLEQDVPAFN